jgi:putative ABC transport system permease protein
MIKHILKLIWKRKKTNFLMVLEIFISFLILFAVWSLCAYTYRNYVTPSGLAVENRWVVFLEFNTGNDTLIRQNMALVNAQLKGFREIESWSFASGNVPFSNNVSTSMFSYNGKDARGDFLHAQETFSEVMGIKLASGRWFKPEDTIGGRRPAIINHHLAEALFDREDPLGKIMRFGGKSDSTETNNIVIIGIMDYYRHKSSFQADENCIFLPADISNNNLILRVTPTADAYFEAKLTRSLQQLGKDWTIEVQHMDSMRDKKDKQVFIPILLLFIICGFLVFNVALGLFGVLYQTISRRKGEIGIRRAAGATQSRILYHFIGETMMVTTMGVLAGAFFAFQIPLLNLFDVEMIIYIWGGALAVISIYLITILCAYYPSKQASAIFPATALHED